MVIKVKKTWRDLVDNKPQHHGLTRRDFLMRGMATGVMSVAVNKLLMGDLVRSAWAQSSGSIVCPPTTLTPGAIAQIYAQGGPTMGARFFSDAQASALFNNTPMANNYGIAGTNLVHLGPNLNIDGDSAFGFTLLQGPPGFPGGATAWKANVLSKLSAGGHLGPFDQDDGNGQNTGLLGCVSPFKQSQMGKDLRISQQSTPAAWTQGQPAASVSSQTPAALANVFTMTPAAAGLTNPGALAAASAASADLANAMAPVLNNTGRKAASTTVTNAFCAFNGNTVLSNPTYGPSLFDPTSTNPNPATGTPTGSALGANVTIASLTQEEQAQVSAYYNSAIGVAGGVIMELGGRDYHGATATTIAAADIEEARAFVMFLTACVTANSKGSMIYVANGQAIANGVNSTTTTINNGAATPTSITVNAPAAQGDAGGNYNAGLILFYDPAGSPPVAKYTGTLNSSGDGGVKMQSGLSPQQAMAGLYLSALSWVGGGKIPNSAISAMSTSITGGFATSAVMVI